MASTDLAAMMNKDQLSVYETMPKAWKERADKALSLRDQLVEANIMTRHALGEIVRELVGDERRYGESAVPNLAIVLGERANFLWECRQFAMTYSSDRIEQLMLSCQGSGWKLSWSHFERLSSEDLDAKTRRELELVTVRRRLSVSELVALIQQKKGKRGNNKAGRAPLPPRNPLMGMEQMSKSSIAFLNRTAIWDTGIFEALENAGADQLDVGVLQQMEDAKQNQYNLAKQALANAERYAKAIGKVKKKIQSKKEPEVKPAARRQLATVK